MGYSPKIQTKDLKNIKCDYSQAEEQDMASAESLDFYKSKSDTVQKRPKQVMSDTVQKSPKPKNKKIKSNIKCDYSQAEEQEMASAESLDFYKSKSDTVQKGPKQVMSDTVQKSPKPKNKKIKSNIKCD